MKLEARGLGVGLGGRTIVEGAHLVLAPGELVGLIGPNGAGKSTLIRALAGLLPHTGTVLLDGRPADRLSPRERARSLAFLPQQRRVEWAVSVREVVALGRHPFRETFAGLTPADEAAIEEALAMVEAMHLAHRPANALSGGETARILLARALAVGAPLLLADEPTAALDPYHQLHVMELLRARAQRGTGVLAVLHDLTLAARFCDRLVVLQGGRIVGEGAPADILDATLLEEVYRITPLTGEHDGRRWLVPWERLPTASPSEARS